VNRNHSGLVCESQTDVCDHPHQEDVHLVSMFLTFSQVFRFPEIWKLGNLEIYTIMGSFTYVIVQFPEVSIDFCGFHKMAF
jgi:hypothetical protein